MKTFEEWSERKITTGCSNHLSLGHGRLVQADAAREIWNAAREGMVPAPVWISVDERLPALQEPVLVWGLASLVPMRGWLDNEGKWRRETGTDGPTRMTHWMPMPPPPPAPDPFEAWWATLEKHTMDGESRYFDPKDRRWVLKNGARAIWDAAKKTA